MEFTIYQSLEILAEYGLEQSKQQYLENKSKKVIVGMSGGVDSSVAALVLKLQGYEVYGMFMKNWEEEIDGVCPAEDDYQDVINVCEHIDVPYYSINFAKEYKENVFDHFLKGYKEGRTPNPDILCNREIKFKVFFEHAMKLGADYLATGHYCQRVDRDGNSYLVKGNDSNKDQTYFLYTMKEEVLKNVLFPIGAIEKPIVRKIAQDFELSTSKKKDSTGICFIGERNFKNFISDYIQSTKGNFVDLEGNVLGQHDGHPFYTKGQRKGLGIGGPGGPYFVSHKNINENEVVLCSGEENPALYSMDLAASDVSWVGQGPSCYPYKCFAKNRYRQEDQVCTIESFQDGILRVTFDEPQRAVTEEQSIVFYDGDVCLGGAIIKEVGPSLLELSNNKQASHQTSFS